MSASAAAPPLELARNDFAAAKRAWRLLLLVQGTLAGAAAAATAWPAPVVAYVALVVGLVGSLAQFAIRWSADSSYERAEAARRLRLLSDGLALRADALDLAKILAEASRRKADDPEPRGAYFNSDLPPGPRRLTHLLWESAHCTTQLARATGTWTAAVSSIGAMIVVGLFVTILALGPPGLGVRVAGAGTAMLALVGFGVLADLARNFYSLGNAAELTCARCERLLESKATRLENVLPTLEGYNTAVARTAPIPTFIWESRQEQLAASWEAIRARFQR